MTFEMLDKEKTAIFIVDAQNGFTLRCKNELPVAGTDEKWIDNLNIFLDEKSVDGWKILGSRDLHPENHVSFSIWPPHCVINTNGSDLIYNKDLLDLLINKATELNSDSYSAFYNSENVESGLDIYLKNNEIENLIIIGLAGDYCVLATIKDALNFNYNVYYIEEYIKSVSEKSMKEILKENNIFIEEIK